MAARAIKQLLRSYLRTACTQIGVSADETANEILIMVISITIVNLILIDFEF